MKKIILIVCLLIIETVVLLAKEQNFSFVAKVAPEGVYLRWGAIDGNFPENSDVATLELKRDGVRVATFNPYDIMDTNAIKALYLKPQNNRSLKKIIDSISKNNGSDCSGANLNNFAQKIGLCMQNPMWRALAAKTDFNLAMVMQSAYLDTNLTKSASTVTYELLGINNSGVKHRLGKIAVNLNRQSSILGAKDFKQIKQSQNCNAPEYAKDDSTVSLTWKNGGDKTDAFINNMMVAGYDLYRSKQDNIDVTALSKTATTDGNGDYIFSGLEKVNETPIMIAHSENSDSPLYMETLDSLKKVGLKPGDTRWYYLVPIDFTGAYGPTTKLKVTIPNLLPPVTPWAVRAKEEGEKVQLVWDTINVKNYIQHYKNTRKICNTNTITNTSRLRYVENDGVCGTKELSVNLDVGKYAIYRFKTPLAASRFAIKYKFNKNESINQQCQAVSPTNGELVKTLNASDFQGKEFVRFTDTNTYKAKYYWYRIVSISPAGIYSILTEPIRAMVPDRTLPQKPKVTLKVCEDAYTITQRNNESNIAIDTTTKAKKLSIFIQYGNGSTWETQLSFNAQHVVPFSSELISKLTDEKCNIDFIRIDFLDEQGNLLSSKEETNIINCRESLYGIAYILSDNCFPENINSYETVSNGQMLKQMPLIEFNTTLKPDECMEFTLTMGDKRHKIGRDCGNQSNYYNTQELNLSNLGKGEMYCIGLTIYNANNQHSPTSYLPCFGKVDNTQPNRPNIVGATLKNKTLNFSWKLPQEKVASTLISVYDEHNISHTYLRNYPNPDHMNKGGIISQEINISNTGNITPKWCIKAKSIGFNAKTSPWSKVRCIKSGNINALAWPHIPKVRSNGETLTFKYDKIKSGAPLLFTQLASIQFNDSNLPNPFDKDGNYNTAFIDRLKESVKESFGSVLLGYAFYRQENDGNQWSPFVQVSPLVQTIDNLRVIQKGNSKVPYIVFALDNNLRILVDLNSDSFNQATLYYIDNYPYKRDMLYRYVKVYFDKDYEIDGYTISNKISTGGTL